MTFNASIFDKMTFNEMTFNEITFDRALLDKMTVFEVPHFSKNLLFFKKVISLSTLFLTIVAPQLLNKKLLKTFF
jgi:hypothetical protein